jgi:tyrosine-protein phosphatase SIW14
MKISFNRTARVLPAILAFALTCGEARGFQTAASDAPQSGGESSATSNAPNSAASTAVSDVKPAPPNPQHMFAKMISVNGIPRFGEVSPQLYRGAQPSSEGIEFLAKMGVEIIVNLRPGDHPEEEAEAGRLGMRYVSIPWQCYHPNDTAIANFLHVLRENPDKKIFVHCELGSDRTGMSIAAYRMSVQGWSADDAMKEMQAYGFTSSHHLTCRGLAGYEQAFPRAFESHLDFLSLRPLEPAPANPR